jgi:hypothetical protein
MQLHEETYQNDLLKLISEITKIENFSHLEKLDGGKEKGQNARKAVKALQDISKTFIAYQKKQEEVEQTRRINYEKQLLDQALRNKIDTIKGEFYTLLSTDDHQKRGFQLEKY